MTLRHIEAFRAVSTTGSMTEAARRIHTSQPQVSRLIAQLEEITELALFHRNGSRLTPTVDGSRFIKEVEKTFAGLAGLEVAAARIRSFSATRLSVAAMPRLAGGLLARAVARFKREFPDVMITIQSGDAGSVHSWVSSGLCDLGLAMLYDETPGVRILSVLTTNCVAVLPRAHPLTDLAELEPKDFIGQDFISLPRNSALRVQIDKVFVADAVKPRVTVEASLGATTCALVAAGLGVSLINPLAASEEQAGTEIETRPFRPNIPVKLVLMYPEHDAKSRLVDVFSEYVAETMRDEFSRHFSTINS